MSDSTVDAGGEGITSLEVPVAILSCIVYIFVGIAIHHYKETYHHMPWIHESSVVCLFGVIMGAIILRTTGEAVTFDNNLFFYLVLPPIIFSAGYSLKRRNFFKYMDLIAFFGIVGTIVNFVLIAAGAYAYGRIVDWPGCYRVTWYEALVFSAVLTGSDEVSARSLVRIKDFPRMGALIFGEGVVNDALSIVLVKTFLPLYNEEFQSISLTPQLVYPAPSTMSILGSVVSQLVFSVLIGVSCGLIHARLMRGLPVIKHFPIYQTALVLLFGYLSYCIAEVFGISGILTIFVAAITLAHYSWYNLSSAAQIATRISFAGISEIAEGFAFAYVGLSLWVHDDAQINILFSVYMIVVVILARLLGFLALFKICSVCLPSFRVPLSEQLCFVLGGVVRGCLCWAQILQVHHSPVLVTTALIIVMFTSLASGVVLPMLLPMLQPVALPAAKAGSAVKAPHSPANGTMNGSATHIPFPPNGGSPYSSGGGNGNGGYSSVTPYTPVRQGSEGDIESASHSGQSPQEETKEWDARSGACQSLLPLRTPERGGRHNVSSGQHDSGPELHFEYEPFSADFPRTQPRTRERDRAAIHSPVRNPDLANTPTPHYSEDLTPDPLDDLRTNEELIELISSQQAAGNRPSVVSMLFWQWVRFDETFMKPLFGGSDRRYRLLRERSRLSQEGQHLHHIPSEAESVDHPAVVLSSSASVELPPLHPRSASSQTYGSLDSVEVNLGSTSQHDLPGLSQQQGQPPQGHCPHPFRGIAVPAAGQRGRVDGRGRRFDRGSMSSDSSDHDRATPQKIRHPLPPQHQQQYHDHAYETQRSPLVAAGIADAVDKFLSPGGREYALEEEREDEIELDRMADEICALDKSMDGDA